jgi:phage gp36-like protein
MPSSTDIALLASAARGASGTGASVDLGLQTGLTLDLAVSAAGGASPTLDVSLETSKDGAVWRTLGAFPRVTAAGPVSGLFAGADRYLRAVWTLGGVGPSFTFGLAGRALLLYATPAQVGSLGVASEALASIAAETMAEHLIANTDDVDDVLGNRFKLPLVKWPSSLTKHLATITAWTVLSHRGVNPQTGDKDIESRHNDAWKKLRDVAENRSGSVEGYVDSTPTVSDDCTFVWSRRRRR